MGNLPRGTLSNFRLETGVAGGVFCRQFILD